MKSLKIPTPYVSWSGRVPWPPRDDQLRNAS
jgi:hypothetical protein